MKYVISLIIHEQKTNEMSAMTEVVVYVIQNSPDLHKLLFRFSQPKSFNIFRIFDGYERLHGLGSVDHMLFTTCASVLYRIYNTTRPLML